jgi:hypothetical protein
MTNFGLYLNSTALAYEQVGNLEIKVVLGAVAAVLNCVGSALLA